MEPALAQLQELYLIGHEVTAQLRCYIRLIDLLPNGELCILIQPREFPTGRMIIYVNGEQGTGNREQGLSVTQGFKPPSRLATYGWGTQNLGGGERKRTGNKPKIQSTIRAVACCPFPVPSPAGC